MSETEKFHLTPLVVSAHQTASTSAVRVMRIKDLDGLSSEEVFIFTGMPRPVLGKSCTTSIKYFAIFIPH